MNGDELIGYYGMRSIGFGSQFYFLPVVRDTVKGVYPIRDTQWGNITQVTFLFGRNRNIYSIWCDNREGNNDVYFSSLIDGGLTWIPNVRVNNDRSGQDQTGCMLIESPDGTLFATWSDNRNPQTLYDIFLSSSTDQGMTWKEAIKVNDDTTHSFQIQPYIVCDQSGCLSLLWTDYRERGALGDLVSNIFFSSSRDGGKTWSRNINVSTSKYGNSFFPILHRDNTELLHCIFLNEKENPDGDIFYAYSKDGGMKWSEKIRVNDSPIGTRCYHRTIGFLPTTEKNELRIGWTDNRTGSMRPYFAELRQHPDSTREERDAARILIAAGESVRYGWSKGDSLFQEEFEDQSSAQWNIVSGYSFRLNGSLVVYGNIDCRMFIGNDHWSDYCVDTRFKLDAREHKYASIFFRAAENKQHQWRCYRVVNFFRKGITLEYLEGSKTKVLVHKPYPVLKDTWYTARVMIKDHRLMYFLNDSLLFSANNLYQATHGSVGLGAEIFPAYYDYIRVHRIKE